MNGKARKALAAAAYWALSLTWGIIASLIGAFAALGALCLKGKPEANGPSFIVRIGKGWGGVSMGPFALCSEDASEHTRRHEFGHSLQNALMGPLWPFLVGIPSAVRYWIFAYRRKRGKPNPEYDSAWFEGTATEWGTAFMERWERPE